MRCENFEKVGAEIRHLGPKKLSNFFSSFFGVIFTHLGILSVFGHFLDFSGNLGVLRAIVS